MSAGRSLVSLGAGLALLAGGEAFAADAGGSCPRTDPIDPASLPYVSPEAPMPGACSAADLAKIKAALPTSSNDEDVKKMLTATCAACVFTDVAAARWGPVPETNQNGASVPVTFDVGGCYEEQTGDRACGKAYQNLIDCGLLACAGCPDGDMGAYDACLKAANTGACSALVTSYQTACMAVMDKYTAAQAVCEPTDAMYLFEGTIAVFCGGTGDAGSSAPYTPNVPVAPQKDAGSGGGASSSGSGCSSAGGADLSPIALAAVIAAIVSRRRAAGSTTFRSAR